MSVKINANITLELGTGVNQVRVTLTQTELRDLYDELKKYFGETVSTLQYPQGVREVPFPKETWPLDKGRFVD